MELAAIIILSTILTALVIAAGPATIMLIVLLSIRLDKARSRDQTAKKNE